MEAVLDRDKEGKLIRKAGIMGIVVQGGLIKPGDSIKIEQAPGVHIPLDRV